ncbi:hypothetical protein AVS7_02224, partial [Acidovorax sp. MR-S7]
AHAVHAQRAGHALAVQRVGGAGQRGAAQGQHVHALSRVAHALLVACEHLHVGQQVVGEAHGLRHLQVGEARQDHLHVLLGHLDQRQLQLGQQAVDQVDFAAQPQAHVGGHLVVAAAAGVQALAGVAHQLRQARLDVQVHVLQVELPVEIAALDLLRDLRHAALDVRQVLRADDGLRGQHLGVGQAARDVGLPQALVEEHARRVALDQIAHGLGKQGRPGLGLGGELVLGRLRGGRRGHGGNNSEVTRMPRCKKRKFYRPAPCCLPMPRHRPRAHWYSTPATWA